MVDYVDDISPSNTSVRATGVTPAISVIIPVKDDAERLGRCLEQLGKQTISDPFEVLVIDNGSARSPQDVVSRYPFARLLTESSHGSYAARNAGLKEARGAILAFTDSDCVPDEAWLEEGVKTLEAAGPDAWIGGDIHMFHIDPQRPSPAELWDEVHGLPQRMFVEQEQFAATANMMTRRTSMDKVGPFQQTFISAGDREWGNRATDSGVKGTFAANVVVNHPSRSSLQELRKKNLRMLVGDVQLRRREGRTLITAREFLIAVCPPIPTLVRDLPKLQPPTLRSRLLYSWAAIYITYTNLLDRLKVIRSERNAANNH